MQRGEIGSQMAWPQDIRSQLQLLYPSRGIWSKSKSRSVALAKRFRRLAKTIPEGKQVALLRSQITDGRPDSIALPTHIGV